MDLVSGSPAGRRDYLDATLSQVDAAYAAALETYTETLRQRNALLRHLAEEGGDPAQLDPLDEQLAQRSPGRPGPPPPHRRPLPARRPLHAELTGGRERLRLEYQPNFDPARPPALTYQMSLALEEPGGPPPGVSPEDLERAFLRAFASADGRR